MVIGALVVVTGSMEPTINIKEMIFIKEQNNYTIGDIVTYKDINDNLVTHRIINCVGDTVITRGDNNTVSDEPIKKERIEGKVCYHSIVLGEFFIYWLKPILIIISVCLFLNIVKSIFFRRNKDNEKEK